MNKRVQGWITKLNELGMHRIPFFFMIDFEKKHPVIIPLSELDDTIQLSTPDYSTTKDLSQNLSQPFTFEKYPMSFDSYNKGFKIVKDHLKYGNSFLTNYTCKTPIVTNLALADIYAISEAKYKLLFKDQFTVFSPESFVTLKDGAIYSYPMKGTIDANIPNARQFILDDPKELAEHYTIVDLIRNDLSRVANKVHVPRFRYIERINSNDKDLLQVSSEIKGTLPIDYKDHLGEIIDLLLPAGSISGAPKKSTLEIIKEAEGDDRGMYTGIFGIFDGNTLDTAVSIRYIENNKDGQKIYRSGGGITHQSSAALEYQEMIDKVYVPINRKYKDLQWESLQHPVA